MIEMIDIGQPDIIAYRVDGKITAEEMSDLFSILREKLEKGEELRLYQEVVGFSGVEVDAIMEKFRFLKEFGISRFDRIAVVTPKKWLSKIVDLEDKIFRSVKMKGFSIDEKEQAIEFLTS